MSNLSITILSDPVNKWFFSNAKTEAYLVGGYIRDLLGTSRSRLREHISKDKDYIVKTNIEEIAMRAAKKFNGTFIVLKKNQLYRVVLKNKQFIDFTCLKGPVHENLKQRDFTINAIAWSPETNIVDPCGGLNDLNKKLIKVVAAENLADDPLRVLRAYRLAADLDFTIEQNTRKYLKHYSKDLVKTASERITEELFKILNNKDAGYYLKHCYKDRVLEKILKLKPLRLSRNLKILTKFEKLHVSKQTIKTLESEISQGLTRTGLIRLVLLLQVGDSTLRDRQHIIDKKKPLRFSRIIQKALRDIHSGLTISKGVLTDKKLYKIFKVAENNALEMATILCITKEKNKFRTENLRKRFLKRAYDFMKVKNKILTGNEIQKILNIVPGVFIGDILSKLEEKQFHRTIKTKAEAKAWLLSNFT